MRKQTFRHRESLPLSSSSTSNSNSKQHKSSSLKKQRYDHHRQPLPSSSSSTSNSNSKQHKSSSSSSSDDEYLPTNEEQEYEEREHFPSRDNNNKHSNNNNNGKSSSSSSSKKRKNIRHSQTRAPIETLSIAIEGSDDRICLLTNKVMKYCGKQAKYGKWHSTYLCTKGCEQIKMAFMWNDHVRRCGEGHYPFKCEWPGCNESFARNAYLKQHMDSHQKVRYQCEYCLKEYSRYGITKKHIKDLHPGKSSIKINKIVKNDVIIISDSENDIDESSSEIDKSSSAPSLSPNCWIFLRDERLYAQLLHLDGNEWVANLYKFEKERYKVFSKKAKISMKDIENNYLLCANSEVALIMQQFGRHC